MIASARRASCSRVKRGAGPGLRRSVVAEESGSRVTDRVHSTQIAVRLSLSITNYSWPSGPAAIGAELARIARAADDAGLDTVWVTDHLVQADPTSTADAEMLEAYSTLGFLAAQTARVRLGTMVTGVTFRPPTMLIKAVTTLDVLSDGRAWLGIGAGYQQDEARAMDLPLPPLGERFERLKETLRLALRMWSGDRSPFPGRHYRPQRPVNNPPALRKPHPPILIGGMGERKTLRLVAEHGDACNLFDIPDGGETIRRKLAVLARHCDALGRRYEEIEKTVSTRLEPSEAPERLAERCTALAGLGIQHAVFITTGPWTEDAVARLGTARERLHA
jgi:F420-dependent oxidoreductase-like protein